MAFLLPVRRIAQPPQQASRINWESPLTQGLQHIYSAAYGNGFINIGGIASQGTKGVTFQSAQGGFLSDRYGEAAAQRTRQRTTQPGTSTGWTIAAIITVISLPASRVGLIGHNNLGGSVYDRSILVNELSQIGGYLFDGAEKIAWAPTPITIGKTFKVIVWYDPVSGTVNSALESLLNTNAVAATSSGIQTYGTSIYFGVGDTAFDVPPPNYITLALKATLTWTPQMRQAFFDNPWQLFAPTSSIRVTTSAPVVSTIDVGEYTSRGLWRGIFRGIV